MLAFVIKNTLFQWRQSSFLCVQLQPPCRTSPGQGNVQHLLPRPRTSPGQGRYKAASARIAKPCGRAASPPVPACMRGLWTIFSSSRFCCSVITDRDGGTQNFKMRDLSWKLLPTNTLTIETIPNLGEMWQVILVVCDLLQELHTDLYMILYIIYTFFLYTYKLFFSIYTRINWVFFQFIHV